MLYYVNDLGRFEENFKSFDGAKANLKNNFFIDGVITARRWTPVPL